MSSDILLEEIRENVKNFVKDPKFLTNQLKDAQDKINSIVIAEQVKLGSLRRQHELVNKLHAELPNRISEIEKECSRVLKDKKELESVFQRHSQDVDKISQKNVELKQQFDEVLKNLHIKRVDEALSIIQREQVWELITKVLDLRKYTLPLLLKSADTVLASAEKERSDFEYLSMRIDQNDALIKITEEKLNSILAGNHR
jgi:hypothetical protein